MAKAKAGTQEAIFEQYQAPTLSNNSTFHQANNLRNFYNSLNSPELTVKSIVVIPVVAGGEILTWEQFKNYGPPEDRLFYIGLSRKDKVTDEDFGQNPNSIEIAGLSLKLAATQANNFEKAFNLIAAIIPGVGREEVYTIIGQSIPAAEAAIDASLSKVFGV